MNTADEVRLALSPQVLARLLAEKRLYADDFRCLDQQAKLRVKSMFLANLRLKTPGLQVSGASTKYRSDNVWSRR